MNTKKTTRDHILGLLSSTTTIISGGMTLEDLFLFMPTPTSKSAVQKSLKRLLKSDRVEIYENNRYRLVGTSPVKTLEADDDRGEASMHSHHGGTGI